MMSGTGVWTKIAFDDLEGEAILHHLNRAGIAASLGSARGSCSIEPHVLRAMGVPEKSLHGAVRLFLSREQPSKRSIGSCPLLSNILAHPQRKVTRNRLRVGRVDKLNPREHLRRSSLSSSRFLAFVVIGKSRCDQAQGGAGSRIMFAHERAKLRSRIATWPLSCAARSVLILILHTMPAAAP
ncbi:hypothetical protein ACVWXO_001158 [Bradyrhizobium sp. LM2.7]